MSKDITNIRTALSQQHYIASDEIATVVFLAERLGKPILAEGPAGVGKTELSKAWAAATGRELIRLQCYEGLDETKALYEWEYAKQLLYTQPVSYTHLRSATAQGQPPRQSHVRQAMMWPQSCAPVR